MSKEEFLKRSEYAAKKLFEMQQNSMPPTPPFVRTQNNFSSPKSEPQNIPSHCENEKKKSGILSKDILKFLDLKNFDLDSDRMLLLLMILILSGEGGDDALLFALAYIML